MRQRSKGTPPSPPRAHALSASCRQSHFEAASCADLIDTVVDPHMNEFPQANPTPLYPAHERNCIGKIAAVPFSKPPLVRPCYHVPMVSQPEIYRIAQIVIDVLGDGAAVHAAQRADAHLEAGDMGFCVMCLRIGDAIDELQRTAPVAGVVAGVKGSSGERPG